MVVTALVLSFGVPKNKGSMSDDDVIKRAQELGMVTTEKTEEIVGPSDAAVDKPADSSAEQSYSQSQDSEGGTYTDPFEGREVVYSDEPVIVEIPEHTDYKQVSHILYEKGLVRDEDEFAKYLANKGYSYKIVSGVYEIPRDMEEAMIARTIAGIY